MGFLIFVLVMAIIGALAFGLGKFLVSTSKHDETVLDDQRLFKNVGVGLKVGAVVVFGLSMLVAIPANALHIVPAGNVGVVYTFGDITGQTDSGLVITFPWQDVRRANVKIQTLAFTDSEDEVPEGAKLIGGGLDSFSEETQNVFISAILRIKVSPDDVQSLYRNVGPDYINKLVPGAIAQTFKDETVNYSAIDIAPNRETIRANVEKAIALELNRFSIDVDALLIENIAFADSFEGAIQAKQDASQEALKEQELVAAETAKADQKIEAARGVATALVVEAEGQAEANRLLTESLSSILVQWQAVQKLADNVQIALIPAGEGVIIDPAGLLGTLESAPAPAPEATPGR